MSFRGFPDNPDKAEASPASGDASLSWELLVTDGHVLAAQLRRVAPWLVAAGIVLLIVAVSLPATDTSSPWAWTYATSSQRIELNRSQYIQPIIDRLQYAPTQQFTLQQVQDLAPVEELPEAITAILSNLNAGGGLTPKLYFKEIPSSSFWSWEWMPRAQADGSPVEVIQPNPDGKFPDYIYVAKGSDDTYSFGAFSREMLEYPNGAREPKVVRWVAVARKFSSGWKLVSLNSNDFYLAAGIPSATVYEIPTSLRLALNLPEAK